MEILARKQSSEKKYAIDLHLQGKVSDRDLGEMSTEQIMNI